MVGQEGFHGRSSRRAAGGNVVVRASLAQVRAGLSGGFTLIELLLVLVILGTLAALVVPKFAGRSEQAKEVKAKTDIARLETALDSFEIDNGRYPTTEEGLRALYEQPPGLDTWRRPYIKRGIPKDPWGHQYVYICPGRRNVDGFDLYSVGPDGQEGTEDDVVNWETEAR